MVETPVPDSVSAVQNATNATRDLESEFESGQDGKIREIVMDSEPMVGVVKNCVYYSSIEYAYKIPATCSVCKRVYKCILHLITLP